MTKNEHWKSDPDPHDFPAASDYPSLAMRRAEALAVVSKLKAATLTQRLAKDLLRASRLPLLPRDDHEVARDLKKVRRGRCFRQSCWFGAPVPGPAPHQRGWLSPVCDSYHLDEDALIPCRLADGPLA